MKLKINRYEFDVTNKDWILDNGSCYQCMTLTHVALEYRVKLTQVPTIMSKAQFKQLVKDNKLVEFKNEKLSNRYKYCKFWRFNVE